MSGPRFPEIGLQRSRLVLEQRAYDFSRALSGGEDDRNLARLLAGSAARAGVI
jgi:hypothetical protein